MPLSQEPSFRLEDTPLKNDVKTLGKILGDTLIRTEGLTLFNRVERVRQAAIDRRRGSPDADQRLTAMLSGLDPATGVTLARAFSAYFGLVNMAERIHGIREHMRFLASEEPSPESFIRVLQTLKNSGIGVDALGAILKDLRFIPVFTAHPTEAVRRTLLTKEVRIAQDLVRRINPELTARYENETALALVRYEVGVSWQTDELFEQPTVADEVEHVMFFLSEVIYRVIPALYQRLDDAIVDVYGKNPVSEQARRLVQFASWVGGDMDGNPNVGADTIEATLKRQQAVIVGRYREECRNLFQHLSHSQKLITLTPEQQRRLDDYRQQLPDVFDAIPERYREMPYRIMLNYIEARLAAVIDDAPHRYASVRELIDDLNLMIASIESHGDTGSALIQRFKRRVETFGFHLVTLDLRQDSAVHRAAIAQVLAEPGFVELDRERRTERLIALLSEPLTPALIAAAEAAQSEHELGRCLAVMRAIKESHRLYGEHAIGAYIISMAEGPDDALAVLLLARLAGLVDTVTDSGSGASVERVPLDIAPLFETVDDLDRAAATMKSLLHQPLYRAHIESRQDSQIIMLGYSDSNKESGLAASRWALYRAQKELVTAADVAPGNPVELTLFHGRGGTISRGGGGLHPRNGILAEPTGSMRGRLRVTEQGEIISQKYGLRDIALRTLEMMTGALLERCALGEGDSRLAPAWFEVAAFMAEQSRATYRSMVHQNPDLIPYFRQATPIDVIERLRIGSRPPSRRSGESVENLRAIPWVFAWTQSRHLFTGWFGVGSGLEAAVERFGIDTLRDMIGGWRYFANLIADVEMVLVKTDLDIAKHYAELAGEVGERIYPQLVEEFERTRRWICDIQQEQELLNHEPGLQLNIRLRNPYVDTLSLLQVDFLRRWREAGRDDPELERALIITVKGIARGMQNTG